MSIYSVKQYQSEVEKIIQYGGTKKETAIRNAFYNLLNEYAKQKGLMLIPELSMTSSNRRLITPDGTLKDSLRLDWGYWESKDESLDLDDEIDKKFKKGYPKDNILFEDSNNAVLIQQGIEIMRISMSDAEALDRIIGEFINYERPEVEDFHKAIELFKQDIPKVTDTLRNIILEQEQKNKKFKKAETKFLELCKESINKDITLDDIREMMIQHILTEDIFNTIFDEIQFHRENNIARELELVILTFFTGDIKRQALGAIDHYYKTINATAAQIADHHEKQKFLKVVYEVFYKSYNPKAADRLGVVYTPNEIVKFMIESTDYLLMQHFSKSLEDEGVDILDPAAGTGTFICDIIDYIRKDKLPFKFETEIHANEMAILPYYIANLNIEYTYKQKTGVYKEFKNLCFVDTLVNMGFNYKESQKDLFLISIENAQRIKRQNSRKISVIIGNPPYNANQMNENDNNKNREYPDLDKLIKESFIKYSKAQKTKVYDMYARFYRWAFERLENNGIIAFITNRSFIDSRTFDGFRKCVQDDFDYAFIIDTKSDVRVNPKIAGTTHNIFGIQTGVAVMFLIKKAQKDNKTCQIRYISMDDFWRKEEKLQWFAQHRFKDIPFETIFPDNKNNWLNLTDNDWEELIPICSKDVKAGKNKLALFEIYSTGISTNRDEWIIDISKENLSNKMKFFADFFNNNPKAKEFDVEIKWSRNLKQRYDRGMKESFSNARLIHFNYRPYIPAFIYYSDVFIDEHGLADQMFFSHNRAFDISGNGDELNGMHHQILDKLISTKYENLIIAVNRGTKPFNIVASKYLVDLHFNGDVQCLPLYRYVNQGVRFDNITNWGLKKFKDHYIDTTITKENIFHYVYGVLHNPAYCTKYELNLKRDFPRIPFYNNFWQWAAWGKTLMEMHINFETIEPFPLKEITIEDTGKPKPKLKADKEMGCIVLDEATTLTGIPSAAWEYKLGNRSALEWILDQYKEKKPTDQTIAEKFNTYRFADYKIQVIDLLKRVCTVSVETVKIIKEMESVVKED